MSNKVFVGSLNWSTSVESLRSAFEKFGELEETKVITDRQTGRSRGFGFVTFKNSLNAEEAIREMNGKELDGRPIAVNLAKDEPRRDSRMGGGAPRHFGQRR
jgi:RNA recognition motif-containing protein